MSFTNITNYKTVKWLHSRIFFFKKNLNTYQVITRNRYTWTVTVSDTSMSDLVSVINPHRNYHIILRTTKISQFYYPTTSPTSPKCFRECLGESSVGSEEPTLRNKVFRAALC